MESQKQYTPTFSFEFYPPKTPEAIGKLQTTQAELAKLNPDFFSVTFGAGGSTRDMTFETVVDIHNKTGIIAAPHISCIGSESNDIKAILDKYIESGITRIVALRGDLPSGSVGYGHFRYANELIEFIRKETGDHFHIEVAAYPEFHPQAPNPRADIENFKKKIDAGANGAITQYFYNPFAYYRFIDSCEKIGLDIPIVAGIMPIVSCTQLQRFSEACGAEIPRWILKRLQEFGDDRVSIREFGVDVTTELCEQLLTNGAPGLHFYTMNQSVASTAIWKNLGIDQRVND
ncbi:MAG: methylenetetrahydrofolate reductase [NAD(P)H] [Proteobacteria bacterium]|nr:methylenetetrahydrofolate reductase [NAD(P)H] [Pseudomonadota bacterium]NOG60455.1 methylenetetrahydrofolate reductase [NAD(P)H] [Pseudomonadota bacterium]